MKSLRWIGLAALSFICSLSAASAQSPAITSISVKDTSCTYKVGISKNQCNIAPGMTIIIKGSNFGASGGGVVLCDCQFATTVKWKPTQITAIANAVSPGVTLEVETLGGLFSNGVPYTALGPLITSIVVGGCSYTPGQSQFLCRILPGTQFTINGSYFGPGTNGGSVATCDCEAATIVSWDPNWQTNPSPFNNQIVAVANQAVCGSTVGVFVDQIWSNYVAYTAC